MVRFRTIALIALVGLLLALPAQAQRLIAEVSTQIEKLPQENQNKVRGIGRTVEAYINENDWAPDDYGYDLLMSLDIYFEEARALSFEDRYKATIVISNGSNYQYQDKRWEFSLEPGAQLRYDDQFEPFRSMIDYAVFMVLGYEFDKLRKFGGTSYFETARRICQQARFNSRYYLGWDRREEFVEEILDEDSEELRYLNFLFYTGEWLYFTERDRETAKQYLLYAIKMIDRIRDRDDLERFFNQNYYNYATALSEYEEWSSLSNLASLDPNDDHSDFYDRLLKRR